MATCSRPLFVSNSAASASPSRASFRRLHTVITPSFLSLRHTHPPTLPSFYQAQLFVYCIHQNNSALMGRVGSG